MKKISIAQSNPKGVMKPFIICKLIGSVTRRTMKLKLMIAILIFSHNYSLIASSCYSPFRYKLTTVAKTVLTGTVKIEKGKYYVVVDCSV